MLGIDLCAIDRLEKIYQKYGEKFLQRTFTEEERDYLKKKKMAPRTMAGLFAAKEAMAKALGTGIGPVAFKDLEVLHKPQPQGRWGNYLFQLSISHEGGYAVAVALGQGEEKIFPSPSFLKGKVKTRELNAHKGSVGKVALLAGHRGMVGAFLYAARALYRTGAGMVFGLVAEEDLESFSLAAPEVVLKKREEGLENLLPEIDALVVGPGLGQDPLLKEVVESPIHRVIDADAITYLSGLSSLPNLQGAVLTPHEAEARRLFHCQDEREGLIERAKNFAKTHQCSVVLKGPGTYVTDGIRDYVNQTGNPSMAVAGMGDCLSGIIGYFLATMEDPYLAACMGVFIHGAAGDLANEKYGQSLMPMDVIQEIPQVLKNLS